MVQKSVQKTVPFSNRTYPALETLTEPHRLIACLHCTVAVGRTMLGSPERYPEGRMHVLPLLNFSLPGIDPNDIKKCLVSTEMDTNAEFLKLMVRFY